MDKRPSFKNINVDYLQVKNEGKSIIRNQTFPHQDIHVLFETLDKRSIKKQTTTHNITTCFLVQRLNFYFGLKPKLQKYLKIPLSEKHGKKAPLLKI